MKKTILFILIIAFLCSCSKNDVIAPVNGQYLYENENLTVAVRIDNEETGITIFENGGYVYQSLYRSVYGAWPAYRYEYEGDVYRNYQIKDYDVPLVLICKYIENTVFEAAVSDNQTDVILPDTMQFVLDNRTLDVNGDGVLDSYQPEFSGNKR